VERTCFVYILRCSDGTYYVGHSNNPEKRLAEHNRGSGARYTSSRYPVDLVYSENSVDKNSAIAREKQIKNWSRFKKEALINNDISLLKSLAKSKVKKN
jgi:predicted GIY-YIG superfamily endonuclease